MGTFSLSLLSFSPMVNGYLPEDFNKSFNIVIEAVDILKVQAFQKLNEKDEKIIQLQKLILVKDEKINYLKVLNLEKDNKINHFMELNLEMDEKIQQIEAIKSHVWK